ncbi:MAG: desulforedoxin [Candidatus Bathyarchaeum sp.]|nr:MAG: desulforedoxin [Candidatus Bathyarchaeum sp.]
MEVKNVTEEGQVYLCEICGNKVKVIESGAGTLVCCGQDMTLVE